MIVKGTYVAPVRTVVTAQQVIEAYHDACMQLWRTEKPETIAALVAQSGLETALWFSMWCDNVGNIKPGGSWEGLYTAIRLNEVRVRKGKRKTIWYDPIRGELVAGRDSEPRYPDKPHALPPGHPQCRLRAYRSLAEGVADKLRFLDRGRYASAKAAALAGDPDLYARRLGEAGYYTANQDKYARAVVSLWSKYLPMVRAEAQEPVELSDESEHLLCLDMAECMRVEIPDWLRQKVEVLTATTLQVDWDEHRRLRDEAVPEDT